MINNRRFFNLTAWGYDFITGQDIWRDQIRRTLSYVDDLGRLERVLDLGCGPGISSFVLADALEEASIVGIDVADGMIRRARHHHERTYGHLDHVEFHRADVYALPFDEESFDFAVGHSFLYLLPHRREALCAIYEVLRPGGTLVLMEPDAEGSLARTVRRPSDTGWIRAPIASARFATSMVLWRLVSRSKGQLRADELKALFRDAGFDDCGVESTLGGLGHHAVGRKAR